MGRRTFAVPWQSGEVALDTLPLVCLFTTSENCGFCHSLDMYTVQPLQPVVVIKSHFLQVHYSKGVVNIELIVRFDLCLLLYDGV